MHEWKSRTSTSLSVLERFFTDMEHATDDGYDTCKGVRMITKEFTNDDEARAYLTRASYGDNKAACGLVVTSKKTKEWETAYARFNTRHKELNDFEKNLSAAYGRTSERVTCPHCKSSMARKYLTRTKVCPVCGSREIISDSNWKALELKRRLYNEAEQNLAKISEKCGIHFMAAFEWHY